MANEMGKDIFTLYRFNKDTQEYKNFKITKSKDGYFMTMMQGIKNGESKRITIKLEESELAIIGLKTMGSVLI